MSAHESHGAGRARQGSGRREQEDRAADRGDRAVPGALGNARQGRADRIRSAKNVEASNLWAFFQAKSIRRTVVQTAAEQTKLGSAPPATMPPRRRCRSRSTTGRRPRRATAPSPRPAKAREQLAERAKEAEEERDLATAKYHHFELASAAFQIGIVLASATIITGIVALAWISGLLTLAGIAFTALGMFAPHAVASAVAADLSMSGKIEAVRKIMPSS